MHSVARKNFISRIPSCYVFTRAPCWASFKWWQRSTVCEYEQIYSFRGNDISAQKYESGNENFHVDLWSSVLVRLNTLKKQLQV